MYIIGVNVTGISISKQFIYSPLTAFPYMTFSVTIYQSNRGNKRIDQCEYEANTTQTTFFIKFRLRLRMLFIDFWFCAQFS